MGMICLFYLSLLVASTFAAVSYNTTYTFDASSTVWNPLKGFVPYYYGTDPQPAVNFPHSMENHYFPMKDLMLGFTSFDFSSIETVLTNVARRNHHAIVRVYVDYPGQNLNLSLPDFLWDGLAKYSGPAGEGLFPDYNNQTLIDAMVTLITELGRKYDGDIRIGFWQVGFLGHWGEWHTYPNETYFASKDHQSQILSAFNSSFIVTKVQLRYFATTGNKNATAWNVGFHDDSFFQDTYGEAWMFYNTSVAVGAEARWRDEPIGGEVRPEFWPCVFASDPVTACRGITTLAPLNWATCVQLTHSTYQWLSYAFSKPGYTDSDYARAINGSIMQGYSFFVSQIVANEIACSGTSHLVSLDVTMSNAGVAPFYYPLSLNAKTVNTKTGALISTKSTVVPIFNQLDQRSFVYNFNMTVETDTNVQFSIWLNSTHLVGNQAIVFAVSNASASGIIQLPTFSIAPCTSSIASSEVNVIPFTTGADTSV